MAPEVQGTFKVQAAEAFKEMGRSGVRMMKATHFPPPPAVPTSHEVESRER